MSCKGPHTQRSHVSTSSQWAALVSPGALAGHGHGLGRFLSRGGRGYWVRLSRFGAVQAWPEYAFVLLLGLASRSLAFLLFPLPLSPKACYITLSALML